MVAECGEICAPRDVGGDRVEALSSPCAARRTSSSRRSTITTVAPSAAKRFEVIEVRDISLDSGDFAPDQFDGLVEPGLPTAEDKHVSAFGDKPLGDR